LIARLKDKKIVDVACGNNHALALDDTGSIYVWGCAGML
jgi:alpha-tubulin suppressor-like RCC1 family protein